MDDNKRVRTDWNKLVRDKIPEILKTEGLLVETYKVTDNQIFAEVLLSKLEEEALEAGTAEDNKLLEELGDIETVIEAILELKGWTKAELEEQKNKKDKTNGKFKEKIILKATRRGEDSPNG